MTAEKPPENVAKRLEQHNQGHLLAFWQHLDAVQRQKLLAQIEGLDFNQVDLWVTNLMRKPAAARLPADFAPAPYYKPLPAEPGQHLKYTQARELGKKLIAAGKVAAFVVAGGQGTRLGFDGPKGDFPVTPVKNKTLFQIFAETLAAASKRYRTVCPWYIMTSPLNYDQTMRILRQNHYYGLEEDNVCIFRQGTLPNFGLDGGILLADMANIACSPDGHGGSLKALFKSGAVDDMKKRGVEFISYFQVDNPLINIFDPLFIGLHALEKAEMSSKAVVKTGPKEKVGNFCLVDDRVTVIEYSDLPDEFAERRNPDGSLVFQLGSIAIHIISTSFVEKLNVSGFSVPLHRAVKKIPHIDDNGNLVEPAEPNGVKLESFVFDALPLASKSIILETLRIEEFAPVKNAAGADSVETARRMMVERAANWLESAGVNIPRKPDHSPDCLIEIAPSFALEKDDVKTKLDRIPRIKPADKLYLD
ncbi:MAG: UTP--glucose-1-phosphate uridylyltransferase [Planctomycetota bacterium]